MTTIAIDEVKALRNEAKGKARGMAATDVRRTHKKEYDESYNRHLEELYQAVWEEQGIDLHE